MRTAMRTCLTAVFLTMFVATGRSQSQADARALLDKAIKAYGGEEKLTKHQALTFKSKGMFHALGMKLLYTADYMYQQPDQFRFLMSMKLGDKEVKLTVVSDGKQAWEAAEGKVQEMSKQKLAEFQHTVYGLYVSQLVPLKNKAFTLTPVDETKVDGRPVVGFKVGHNDRRDVTLYFDKETHLLAKIQTRVVDEFFPGWK